MLTIRPMREADLAAVTTIEAENLSPWSVASLSRELTIQRALQYVAESADGQLIGWCACRIIEPEAELLKIAVLQECRKNGVGSLLLGHLGRKLQDSNVTSLFLEVRTMNRIAMSFYEKHGFLVVGTRAGYYTSPPDSATILKKDLTSSVE